MKTRALIVLSLIGSLCAGCASKSARRSIPSGQYETEQAMLSKSSFHKVYLDGARFDDVNLSGATLNNINLSGARARDVNLSGASFDDINLAGSRFDHVNLSSVDIRDAELTGMKIDGILVTDLLAAHQQAQKTSATKTAR